MITSVRSIVVPLLCCALGLSAQDKAVPAQQAPPPSPAQGGWLPAAPAADLERRETAATAGEATVLLHHFLASHYAGLAEGGGTLSPTRIAEERKLELRMAERHAEGFEHHLMRYHLAFPAPEATAHLQRARMLAPARTELLVPDLLDAVRAFDHPAARDKARDLHKAGLVDAALLNLAGDLLLSVEPDAVVFLAGEMDGVPALVRHLAMGESPTTVLVDARQLGDAAYRLRVWAAAKAEGKPPGSAKGFPLALAEASSRPVYLSLAFGPELSGVPADRLRITGIAARIDGAEDNIAMLADRWPRMKKDTNAGPLARNYLLPGSLLLGHYRRAGNEAKAAALEHELRNLAKRLGALPQLYSTGVLEH